MSTSHVVSPPMDQDDTPPSSGLRIQIFYGCVTVHDEYLDCEKGNIIISHTSTEDKQFQNIVLPDNHPHPQARDIFNGMQRGVLIEASDGNVYVTPLCRTVVYCGSSSTDLARPLEKEVRSKVFDYRNHFRPALEHYALVHSQSPTPQFVLSLGQNLGKDRPVSQNLISITVTHIRSRFEFDAVELRFILAQPTPAVSHGMKSAAIPGMIAHT